MATHYSILENEGVRTKTLTSQQQLILEHYTWFQINTKT